MRGLPPKPERRIRRSRCCDSATRSFRNPPRPRAVDFQAIEPTYEVFGWRVSVARKALEFSVLKRATRHGFLLSGSGSAVVKTPPRYHPGKRFVARVRTASGAHKVDRLRAGRRGRLRISLPLGPANPDQEYTAQAQLDGGTKVFTTRVRIEPAPGEARSETRWGARTLPRGDVVH